MAAFTDGSTVMTAALAARMDRGGFVSQAAVGGLKIDVTAMRVVVLDPWAVLDYAGDTAYTVTASVTRQVYLDTSGVLQVAASFPVGAHVPLATIITDSESVTSIVDMRIGAYLP